MGSHSDEVLVERAGRGDRAAAAALVLRHTDKIYAVCYRTLRTREAAEDATQETFLRLWTNANKWRPQGAKLETWLYRVAMNICLDQLRKRKREAPEEAAPEQIDPADRPDQRHFNAERRARIDDAMAKLPDRQRAAIALCHFQELSNIEAAKIMDISVDALESLLARGRRALRDRLSPLRDDLSGRMSDDTKSA
ncbi:MAG: RNA polymerase sigma factor [Pseudomonadota bacterium]